VIIWDVPRNRYAKSGLSLGREKHELQSCEKVLVR
jgi:hypothetical protein